MLQWRHYDGGKWRGIERHRLFSEFFVFRIRIRISLWNLFERVIIYILKIPTKFGVAPQSFCENQNSVQDQDQYHDQDQDFTMKFIWKSYSLYTKDTHQIWCRYAKFLWKSKFCSGLGSGSWPGSGFHYEIHLKKLFFIN